MSVRDTENPVNAQTARALLGLPDKRSVLGSNPRIWLRAKAR